MPCAQSLKLELQKANLASLAKNPGRLNGLVIYLNTLLEWNRRFNLVGLKDWKGILHNLVMDSLYLALYLPSLPLNKQSLILDFGAGAGIPGLPLRIYFTQGTYLMLEPRQKRAAFLQHVLSSLVLLQTEVLPLRVQDLQAKHYPADLVLSRGFCAWPEFLHISQPFLKPNGLALVFSSRGWQKSDQTPRAWRFYEQWAYTLANGTKRYFWLFSLTKECS